MYNVLYIIYSTAYCAARARPPLKGGGGFAPPPQPKKKSSLSVGKITGPGTRRLPQKTIGWGPLEPPREGKKFENRVPETADSLREMEPPRASPGAPFASTLAPAGRAGRPGSQAGGAARQPAPGVERGAGNGAVRHKGG